jgi:predicted acyl esterase
MMGKSWGGFNCLQTAFRQPPALKAVVSVCSTTDRFADDIHFKGGTCWGRTSAGGR